METHFLPLFIVYLPVQKYAHYIIERFVLEVVFASYEFPLYAENPVMPNLIKNPVIFL